MQIITWITLVLISFFCGSLPFSVWLGKIFLSLDVRQFGDGNPGATNVFRSGDKLLGLLALVLDISKAAAPVGVIYYDLGFRGLPMFLVAIAPILGHVFSPFLGFPVPRRHRPHHPIPGRQGSCLSPGGLDRVDDLESLPDRGGRSSGRARRVQLDGLGGHVCTGGYAGGSSALDAGCSVAVGMGSPDADF